MSDIPKLWTVLEGIVLALEYQGYTTKAEWLRERVELFAAVPDLLAACEMLMRYSNETGEFNFSELPYNEHGLAMIEAWESVVSTVSSAIAKARGTTDDS